MLDQFAEYKSVKIAKPFLKAIGWMLTLNIVCFFLSMVELIFSYRIGLILILGSFCSIILVITAMYLFKKYVVSIIKMCLINDLKKQEND